ncbi:23S rRNA (adenine(2030)-N(6))-methyltransferase RlmJ [Brevundimonas sp. 2R-24]|uniref:Ribosomal RNA large subunit methyltransferase J n=1 Tax=Peiella sedimenti TaxID=3061083 RepID=A0ABT8SL95_9CAUL|nr:23S rRNA (adenine(2030)-N(6))-methyltransferase RlmJ [Caulobacteraceae bacterium XZ-24]
MNYRHAYHAGNFADLVKHAVLLDLLARLQGAPAPLKVIDTHAGAGLYRLDDPRAVRSKEAEAGVTRLMAEGASDALISLAEAVRSFNEGETVAVYPGSPALIASRLRSQDGYLGLEMNPEVQPLLDEALKPWSRATSRLADGYETAPVEAAGTEGRAFILIDPPYERSDDYARAAACVAQVLKVRPQASLAIWTPLKDLETFDGFMRRLQAARVRALAVEARLKPLTDPMKMNGCAMVLINPPEGAPRQALRIAEAVVAALGGPAGMAKGWSV